MVCFHMWTDFFPFCRYLMKALSRELSGEQYQNACRTLGDLATSLGSIRTQTTFKKVALLGGVEDILKAIKEVIWHAIDTCRNYTDRWWVVE